MAVDLEELALKSIENYAALNVKMSSLEIAIAEMNRKAESNQDKFGIACDKLTRLEEKISSWMEDRRLIHERIDDTRAEVDKLIELVRGLASTVKDHKDDHCDGCINNHKVDALEGKIKELATTKQVNALDKKLSEVARVDNELLLAREMVTTPQGLLTLKFFTSKWALITYGLLTLDLGLDFFGHYDVISNLWKWLHFSG